MQRDMIQRVDQTSEELRAVLRTLDTRLSRLEGVILPKPWEIPKESPIALALKQACAVYCFA